jgi:hypothetical protein
MRKSLVLVLCFIGLLAAAQSAFAGQTKVGGQLKLTLFDYADGKHNNFSSSGYTGFQFTEADFYISQQINDKVSVDIEPAFEATTLPTPNFKTVIGPFTVTNGNIGSPVTIPGSAATTASNPTMSWEFRRAQVKVDLPQGYEVSCGIVKPRFSWEYGAELFYQDEIVGSRSANNDSLGAMRDSGIEVYKAFELGGVSLPSYLYALNGLPSGFQGAVYGDNNRNPFLMAHVEPEIGPLKLLASVGYGTYDNLDTKAVNRWAAGADYTYQKWNLRTECFAGSWQQQVSIPQQIDGLPLGYYAKLFYRVNPWLRAMLHYDIVDQNFIGTTLAPGRETYQTITPGLQLFLADSAQLILQYDIADWRQTNAVGDVDTLEFNRLVLGWRIVF